jgi:hypothetical protein
LVVIYNFINKVFEGGCRNHPISGAFLVYVMSSLYQKDLNTKQWQDRSHRIKTRDNLKCQAFNCKTPNASLQVHHIDYFNHKKPWQYPDDMLITLCSVCHELENHRYYFEASLYTALKMKGFLACDILAFTALVYTNPAFLNDLLNEIRNKKNG